MSTTSMTSGPHYANPVASATAARSFSDSALDRVLSQPSEQARQTRLQQLTTQLLWRLQQSSPFHSSSNADLVLPVLREATPRLGVPERPAKLLPGLEESQGALYEIGVADNGTLVGLVEDELQESLTNLGAMAASLGCITNVLRKVAVGSCEWIEAEPEVGKGQLRRDDLWVAEVLVYPEAGAAVGVDVSPQALDTHPHSQEHGEPQVSAERASTEQLRVTLVGASTSGKSSLLGTLSTSTLDNGRGKSRLSLLKHRHEIASGITSSVAQELVGYQKDRAGPDAVINYASGNVTSWLDIHNLADRLVFFCDSPGLPRFAKSTFRSLVSWNPSWTILCVAADDTEENASRIEPTGLPPGIVGDSRLSGTLGLSLSHLDLCLQTQSPFMIAITKMDLANKVGLRQVLAKLLSALKAAGRKPLMLSNAPGPSTILDAGGYLSELQSIHGKDQIEIDRLVESMNDGDNCTIVPVLMTSAVTGLGISKMHALLRSVPTTSFSRGHSPTSDSLAHSALFHVDEVFSIPPSRVYTQDSEDRVGKQGVVLCGHVSQGLLSIGNILFLGPFAVDSDSHVSKPILRSRSYCAEQSHLEETARVLAQSYQAESSKPSTPRPHPASLFLRVRVVSLRNLRLPVARLGHGETGTIGVETVEGPDETVGLERARKGMVLMDAVDRPTGYQSFSASFSCSDFSSANSPPLILGGHAIVFVNSVRAAVKVTAVALDEDKQTDEPGLSPEVEVFHFDSDDEAAKLRNGSAGSGKSREIRISFQFVSTVEWMEVGNRVLVVPTVTAPGPITGPTTSTMSGLAGFFGRVSEVFS